MARILFDRHSPDDGWRRTGAPGSDEPATAEYLPPLDLVESPTRYEVIVDLPGLAPDAVTVAFRDGLLIVSGDKALARCRAHRAAFHLAERSFGRFRRIVRLGGAYDASQATASLVNGELRIVVPRIDERRGRPRTLNVAGA